MSIKTIIAATIITLSASSAFAFGNGSSGLQGCGPDITFDAKETENNGGYSSGTSTEFKFGIKWTLGKKSACEANNAYQRDLQLRDIRTKEAQATSAEVNAFNQKIAICKDFTVSTAPASIITFCGDLLDVNLAKDK